MLTEINITLVVKAGWPLPANYSQINIGGSRSEMNCVCVCVLQNSIPSCAQCAIGKDLQQALLKILYNVMSVIVKKGCPVMSFTNKLKHIQMRCCNRSKWKNNDAAVQELKSD